MISKDLSSTLPLTPVRFQLFSVIAFLLGVSLPTANALMNITLALAAICVLWQRDFRYVMPLLKNPLVWLPALMFALLAISLLTKHHDYGPKMVGKYQKLLYILPLALFFLIDTRFFSRFVDGFLLANLVILAISLTSGIGHFTLWGIEPENPTVFKLQITQNVFMALAALVWLSRAFAQSGWKRVIYGALVILAAANVLLMVQGRTGYVTLFAGIGIWLLLTFQRRQRIWVLICGLLIALALIFIPNRATERLTQGLHEIHHCVLAPEALAYQACDNSMGQRTSFVRESLRLIKEAPLLGNGAGSFWYGNAETGYSVHNPHNEYLLQTVHNGLLGLAIFLGWMLCCLRAAWGQPVACRNLLVAVLGSYMACHFFNSFLLDSSEGHLFMIFVSFLVSALVVREAKPSP